MNKTVHVVLHSHWDREWYFTIEDSNVLLVENLDFLLETLENDTAIPSYVFDGQVSVIDEYLKIRPENRDRVVALVAQRRLFIGPWYTQTDTLFVNIESIIRNLLYGVRRAKGYGNCMSIGYLPDVFGQNAWLPSLFCDCSLAYAVFQRGIPVSQLQTGLNFNWRSPDGRSIITNNLFLGYGPGKFIKSDSSYVVDKLTPMLKRLEAFDENAAHLLLPSGGDQMLVRPELPQVIRELNEQSSGYQFILSDYGKFMQSGRPTVPLSTIDGELIAGEKSRVHRTIGSQRVDIKQGNAYLERKITHQLEPLAVIGAQLGLRYPQRWLDNIWTELFDVHAHDSIAGCNSDDTNAAIVSRIRSLTATTDGLINIIKKQITRAIAATLPQQNLLTVFNTTVQPQKLHRAVIFSKNPYFTLHDLDGLAIQFSTTTSEIMPGGTTVSVTADGEQTVKLPDYYRSEILIDAVIPAPGYATFVVCESLRDTSLMCNIMSTNDKTISNARVTIKCVDGHLEWQDKLTGEVCKDLLIFEDCADAGDSYDFSPLSGDKAICSHVCFFEEITVTGYSQILRVRHELVVPGDLSNRLLGVSENKLTVTTTLELRSNEPFTRITHYCVNNSCDHRLRVLLPAAAVKCSFADQGFSLVERAADNPELTNWRERKFAEAPVTIYPFQSIAGCSSNASSTAIFANGLKEYQLLPDSKRIALTLFRSVGLLGKDDLAWRPGRASGINNRIVETPDAQLLQPLIFSYGFYAGSRSATTELFQMRDCFLYEALYYQTQTLNSFEERLERFLLPQPVASAPQRFQLFCINNPDVFVSAIKCGHDNADIILRLYNPDNKIITINRAVFDGYKVSLTNIIEQQEQDFDGDIHPNSYLTLRLCRG